MKPNWEKLESVISSINGGKAEIARRMGEKPATVTNWFLRKSIPLDAVPRLMKATDGQIRPDDINPDYFAQIRDTAGRYDTSAQPHPVPLIQYKDIDNPIDTSRLIYLDNQLGALLSDHTVALTVEDNTMAPSINSGDTIIIDPAISAQPGDIVLARLYTPARHVLAKYRLTGYDDNGNATISLEPANPDFPAFAMTETKTGTIIGPVVEHRARLISPQRL